jgi:hypothetical protein
MVPGTVPLEQNGKQWKCASVIVSDGTDALIVSTQRFW